MAAQLAVFLVLVALAKGQSESEDVSEYCRMDTIYPEHHKLICENMTNEEQLANEFFSSGWPNATRLVITNSHFRFFSHDTFVGMNFTEIEIVNCSIRSLTDTNIAFQGLEDTLIILSVTNTTFVSNWDWNHLRSMSKLRQISVIKSEMPVLTDSIKRIPRHLRTLQFNEDGVSWIHPKAFSHLGRLNILMLPNNEITSIQRSMLPNPAKYLAFILLGGNRLSSLPSDIFTNMPTLTALDLSNNLFHSIEERIFGAVIGKLSHLNLRGNTVRCDCRIKWLTKVQLNPNTISAHCTSPSYLEGTPVVGLALAGVKLWC